MKAVVYTKYGSPDVLEYKDIDKPIPKNNEVLVKVFATTVNRTDSGLLRAKPFIIRFITGFVKPKRQILGTVFAGTIETIGNELTDFKIGDRIFGLNDEGLCAHAEYLCISQKDAIAIIPENTSFEQAAASLEGAHYAYNFINKVNIKQGDTILVNGATGAIGSAMVSFLKCYDVTITAVCDGTYSDMIKSLGANRIVDYTKDDFTQSNEKYDYVFDAVGKSSFGKCKSILKSKGIYMSSELGSGKENIYLPLITLWRNKKVKFPLPTNRLKTVLLIQKLFEEGKFTAFIDCEFCLEQIPEAYRYVEKDQKIGNVIIKVAEK